MNEQLWVLPNMFTSPEIRDSRSVNTYKSQVKKGKDTRKSTMIVIPLVETGDWEKEDI